MILVSFVNVNAYRVITNDEAPVSDFSFEEILSILEERGRSEGWTFTVGETSVSRVPKDGLCGLVDPGNWPEEQNSEPGVSVNTYIPPRFDWRSPDLNPKGRNCMSGIKNQRSCGSCWAFATIAPLESAILREEATEEVLSEQWLINCNTEDYGCDGGWYAFYWLAGGDDKCDEAGAVLDIDCPYWGVNGICNCQKGYPRVFLVKDWDHIKPTFNGIPENNNIKQHIMTYGPVAVGIVVSDDPTDPFYYYDDGIFNNDIGGDISHAVNLVGWNDDEGYWILRNSWGENWGYNGYMKIKYGIRKIGYKACYMNEYERISEGAETVNVYIDELTNDPSRGNFEKIDPALPPQWYYIIRMGEGYQNKKENLQDWAQSGFWPWNWKSEYTWEVQQGHTAYVDSQNVEFTIELYDYDFIPPDDYADINPLSGIRSVTGNYNLKSDVLKNEIGSTIEKEGAYYELMGYQTDNAKIWFDVTDSYDYNLYKPTISVDTTEIDEKYSKGSGSYDITLTISNTAEHDDRGWAESLSWGASDDKTWISLSDTSGNIAADASDEITVTIDIDGMDRGSTNTGEITINSNDEDITIPVTIKIKGRSKSLENPVEANILSVLETRFPYLSILLKNILKLMILP
jgi:hypothetical protein